MIVEPAKPEEEPDAVELVTVTDQMAMTANGRVMGGNVPTVIIKDPFGSRLGVA